MSEVRKELIVSKADAEEIERLLNTEPADHSECMGEDEAITHTVDFGNGIEMDIKLCGVSYSEDEESNKPWTEAVLFEGGCEVACSDADDVYFQEWELEDSDGTTYIADVKKGD